MVSTTSKRHPGTSPARSRGARLCSLSGCSRKHYGKGYCSSHYQQQRNGRLPGAIRPNLPNGTGLLRDAEGRKFCARGAHWVPVNAFGSHPATMDKLQVQCGRCTSLRRRELQYGLTENDIADLLFVQRNLCAICEQGFGTRFVVDHDHACCPGLTTCGRCVRGLLCDGCNLGLGAFRDSVPALRGAIRYMQFYGEATG